LSVYYIWVCDETKQFLDPYPLDAPHLYTICQVFLFDDGTRGWSGCSIRLISDGGDQEEYYLRTIDRRGRPADREKQAEVWGGTVNDIYEDVTAQALAEAAQWFPEKWWVRR